MGKHKRDKIGKVLRDNPIAGGASRSSLGEQIQSDRFVVQTDGSQVDHQKEDDKEPEVL